eukprot:GHVQ01014610.1.p1 GENE.GHVQ01014610.1~~GHVQ01014610.1.p1  ORF type:complete len:203 (-),score=24.30 GHVQ01014610.1:522-1130(-)
MQEESISSAGCMYSTCLGALRAQHAIMGLHYIEMPWSLFPCINKVYNNSTMKSFLGSRLMFIVGVLLTFASIDESPGTSSFALGHKQLGSTSNRLPEQRFLQNSAHLGPKSPVGDVVPPPSPVINLHVEESSRDPIDEEQQAEERRSVRRTMADLEEENSNNIQAIQEVLTGHNRHVTQLENIAGGINRILETLLRGKTNPQ